MINKNYIKEQHVIRLCKQSDFSAMFTIINLAAAIYQKTIPKDRWKEPSDHRPHLYSEKKKERSFYILL